MSEKVMKLIEDVKALTVLELSELVKALEEEFGVSAAAPSPLPPPPLPPPLPLPPKRRPSLTLSWPMSAQRRSRSSRLSASLRALASRKPRIWLTTLPSLSRKLSARTKLPI
jgi:hypothetical protein